MVVYGLGAALAGGFHRSRVFLAVVGLGALDLVASSAPQADATGAFGSVLVLVIGLISIGRDRGVASAAGVSQILGGVVIGALPALVLFGPGNIDAFLAIEILPGGLTNWTGYPQPVVFIGILSLAAAGYGAYRWRGLVEEALLWSQLCVLVAIHPAIGSPDDSLFLMAGGVVLALAVLETSYAMAYRDDLTALPARRALMRDLETIGGTYSVAMVDIDHFKKFNDKHGHDVGDQVLRLTAGHLAKTKGRGKAYRYGGEEFTILFPGRLRDDTLEHLEETRAAVEAGTFSLRSWNRPLEKPAGAAIERAKAPKNLSVTISIGVADSSDSDATPESVLKKADKALYRAKKKGRNRIAK